GQFFKPRLIRLLPESCEDRFSRLFNGFRVITPGFDRLCSGEVVILHNAYKYPNMNSVIRNPQKR
ncbi:MAG: hypothetical protein WCN27_05400, partial [Alphaproteobacteria bacterium]